MPEQELPQDLGISERIRRSHGRPSRRIVASTKLTRQERAELDSAAKGEGKVLSEWAREVLLEKARSGPTGPAIFTELIALRMLVNNILRSLALGRTMTEKEYAQVLAEVRSNKHTAAGDVLTQYQNRTGEQ